jgi:hypothetical protein
LPHRITWASIVVMLNYGIYENLTRVDGMGHMTSGRMHLKMLSGEDPVQFLLSRSCVISRKSLDNMSQVTVSKISSRATADNRRFLLESEREYLNGRRAGLSEITATAIIHQGSHASSRQRPSILRVFRGPLQILAQSVV